MTIFALNGFNSEIYPVTLGAMSSRGFGRMNFELTDLYLLHSKGVEKWLEEAMQNDHAGYFGLKKLDQAQRDDYLKKFKEEFKKELEAKHV